MKAQLYFSLLVGLFYTDALYSRRHSRREVLISPLASECVPSIRTSTDGTRGRLLFSWRRTRLDVKWLNRQPKSKERPSETVKLLIQTTLKDPRRIGENSAVVSKFSAEDPPQARSWKRHRTAPSSSFCTGAFYCRSHLKHQMVCYGGTSGNFSAVTVWGKCSHFQWILGSWLNEASVHHCPEWTSVNDRKPAALQSENRSCRCWSSSRLQLLVGPNFGPSARNAQAGEVDFLLSPVH